MPPDERTDPVETASTRRDDVDLYEVATWEERSRLDALAVALYRFLSASARWLVVLAGAVLFLGIGGFSAVTDPEIGALTALSALPALALAGYVYFSDVTASEPPSLLVGTFLLGIITATFAAILNGAVQGVFTQFGFLGLIVFFYVFVAPVEETVKQLAVGLYAYRDERFDAVVDGAVYGAMAGLGFAFIENALYIERGLSGSEIGGIVALLGMGADITFTRALAGPGHVIYSAFAGYYLGLAKFNRKNWGPIVLKGLVIAALIHGTYNATVGLGSALFTTLGVPSPFGAFAYILLYDGLFGALLFRKIRTYRRTYNRVEAGALGSDGDDDTTAGNSGHATDGDRTADSNQMADSNHTADNNRTTESNHTADNNRTTDSDHTTESNHTTDSTDPGAK
jgi:RsiW-degrading membrane proteinase PrsW (M82 family)